MPTYDFECPECGHTEERWYTHPKDAPSAILVRHMNRRFLAKYGLPAPYCRLPGALFRKIGSGGGVIFKGSGFYATDYAKAKPKNEEVQHDSHNR